MEVTAETLAGGDQKPHPVSPKNGATRMGRPLELTCEREATGLTCSELVLLAPLVIGANVLGELFVALRLEVAHHFIEGWAGGRTRGLEPPATFGTPKTAKKRLLNPYQIAVHGRRFRCA